ncbi:alpha/beta hydrolase [Mycobacterium sp. DSM 3803]|nr:alpha/beta hydrolase [Mycobacterium sp. DSM 3803]
MTIALDSSVSQDIPPEATIHRLRITTPDGIDLDVRDYRSWGRASHTVVLLHGFCLSQNTWNVPIRLLRRHSPDVRIIALDHRGHGRSASAPARTYTIEQLAEDIGHVLTMLDITGPITLAGHSMGGMAAISYLATRISPVPAGLVLVATAAGRLTERGIGRLLTTPGLGPLTRVVDHVPHRGIDRTVRTLVGPACHTLSRMAGFGGVERAALATAAADAVHRTPLATVAGFLTALRTYDYYADLDAITARTVVVSGGNDVITPVAHAADLAAGIPGAVHLHHRTGGHMLLHDAPRLVVDAILTTLTELSAVATETNGVPRHLESL